MYTYLVIENDPQEDETIVHAMTETLAGAYQAKWALSDFIDTHFTPDTPGTAQFEIYRVKEDGSQTLMPAQPLSSLWQLPKTLYRLLLEAPDYRTRKTLEVMKLALILLAGLFIDYLIYYFEPVAASPSDAKLPSSDEERVA